MMKLYYSPGSCAMSCHIALEEAGLSYTPAQLDWDHPSKEVEEVQKLNPLGVVPVLITDQGKTLTQNAAILEYIGDAKPQTHLLAGTGTFERAETVQWVAFVSSDLHKAFGVLFQVDMVSTHEAARKDVRAWGETNVKKYLSHVDQSLKGRDYICGKQFTIADAYLFTVLNWSQWVNIQLDEFHHIRSYLTRVSERPAVKKVIQMEGLND